MSRLRANQITNENANGAPNFPHGLTVTGIVTATTTSTTMPQIVVGSAVTANSQGIDVTGIVTATTVKVGSAISATDGGVAATRFYGDGSSLTSLVAGLQSVQTFTSSGTYTKPTGINKVKVFVTAAGGGGGGGTSDNNAGTGGGAGGTAIELIDVSSLGSTVAVTVGTGGANVTSGTSSGGGGGASSFGSYCSATGGDGGGGADATRLGTGGSGAGGDLNIDGGDGMTGGGGPSSDDTPGGDGGASFWGGGGSKSKLNNNPVAARNGQAYGSGGGGGVHRGGTEYASGNGKNGIVYVEEYA